MTRSTDSRADVRDILQGVVDGVKAGLVFGEPVTQDGVTILPVARVGGGGGGGGGTGQQNDGKEADGAGGGLGLMAGPVGVYVIRDGKVTWSPAVDATRIVLGAQMVMVAVLLLVRAIVKVRHAQPRLPRDERRSRRQRS